MKYLFERRGKQVTVASPMADIPAVTAEMEAIGFHRVYTVPQTYHQLDINDAYDEMVEMDRVEDTRREKAGTEAWSEVDEVIRHG